MHSTWHTENDWKLMSYFSEQGCFYLATHYLCPANWYCRVGVHTALTMLPYLNELRWMVWRQLGSLGHFYLSLFLENHSDDNCGEHKLLLHVGVFEVATQKATSPVSQSYLIYYIILPRTWKYFKLLKNYSDPKKVSPKQSNISTCLLPTATGNKREF